ncbi:MAG: CPBP family glutamic-type intramembrane protease [Sphaerochaeta sp.]|jgi:hypothetical protein|uniref:CPBP family glutamic-type intramembrane protease n=1 Tax=Sphaerochaeta sp. TaxID=1972642 RepID=UPI003D13729F
MKLHPKAIRFALAFFPIGLVCALYLSLSNINALKQAGMDMAPWLLILLSIVQIGVVYSVVLAYFGYLLSERVHVYKPFHFEKHDIIVALTVGLVCAVIMASDYYVFAPYIPQVQQAYENAPFNPVSLLFAMLYGGILEEIMLRLFFLSLLVFILDLLFRRTKRNLPITPIFYVTANILAAAFFALGHLPATKAAFGSLTGLLILRSFVLNGVLGYLFGMLYIKKGLHYAMVAHASTHLFNQVILYLLIL